MIDLAVSLVGNFEILFNKHYPNGPHMSSETLFNRDDAWQIVKNYEAVLNGTFLREILGSEAIPGVFSIVRDCIRRWKQSDIYHEYQQQLEDKQIQYEQDILDQEILEQEYIEESRSKQVASALKKAAIQDRKDARELKKQMKQKVIESEREKLRQALSTHVSDAL